MRDDVLPARAPMNLPSSAAVRTVMGVAGGLAGYAVLAYVVVPWAVAQLLNLLGFDANWF